MPFQRRAQVIEVAGKREHNIEIVHALLDRLMDHRGDDPARLLVQVLGAQPDLADLQASPAQLAVFYTHLSASFRKAYVASCFSASAMAPAHTLIASQSRKSPTGALTFLIIHLSI